MAKCRTRPAWPWIAGAIAGCLLLALSLIGKLFYKPEQVWTAEKSAEYTKVGTKLHGLTHKVGPGARVRPTRDAAQRDQAALRAEYQQTKLRWDELKGELETAQKHGQTPLAILRWIGAGLAIVCLVGWLATRPSQ
jgi:hypothetical protein